MLYVLITFLTALSISFIAIYYSVAGLVAIFAAAPIPIIIMGSVLEIAKLVTVVWLHKFWKQAVWWLKTYLTTAVVVLMFITSIGIFGFLSKAHIEQTFASKENISQEDRINREILKYETIINKAEQSIQNLENNGTGGHAVIQAQIDKEQERIDLIYQRVQPLIDEQTVIIQNETSLFENELKKIDQNLAQLQSFINNGEIAKAQSMVGTRADGKYGPDTATAFTAYQDKKTLERQEWLDKIQKANNTDTVIQAREEISRLRANVEKQVNESNNLINSYKVQLQSVESQDIVQSIKEQQDIIKSSNQELDKLLEKKFILQSNVRKLEAEVGPIKYIAEMIYGQEASTDLLEKAVKWVIIIIIFVFDPLAVLLLIASQYTISFNNQNKKNNTLTSIKPILDYITTAKDKLSDHAISEYASLYQDNSYQKNEINERLFELIEAENNKNYKRAKTLWKQQNPDEDLKTYKQAYLEGKINELPWKNLIVDK